MDAGADGNNSIIRHGRALPLDNVTETQMAPLAAAV